MPSRSFAWTPEAIELLKELFERGASASQTAAALVQRFGGQATRNSVIGKWSRLGLCNTRIRTNAAAEPPARSTFKESLTPPVDVNPPKKVSPAPKPVAKSKPKPVVIAFSGRVALVDLGHFDCRFPLGDPLDKAFGFCGSRAKTGSAYCSEHHALCYQPPAFRQKWDKRIIRQAKRAA